MLGANRINGVVMKFNKYVFQVVTTYHGDWREEHEIVAYEETEKLALAQIRPHIDRFLMTGHMIADIKLLSETPTDELSTAGNGDVGC